MLTNPEDFRTIAHAAKLAISTVINRTLCNRKWRIFVIDIVPAFVFVCQFNSGDYRISRPEFYRKSRHSQSLR